MGGDLCGRCVKYINRQCDGCYVGENMNCFDYEKHPTDGVMVIPLDLDWLRDVSKTAQVGENSMRINIAVLLDVLNVEEFQEYFTEFELQARRYYKK